MFINPTNFKSFVNRNSLFLSPRIVISTSKLNKVLLFSINYIDFIENTYYKYTLIRLTNSLRKIVEGGGQILFASTTPLYAAIIKENAIECNMPFSTYRWEAGTVTAWKIHQWEKRKITPYLRVTDKAKKIKKKLNIKKYKEKETYKKIVAVFIPDFRNNWMILKEAIIANLAVISVVNSDADNNINYITYPIISNEFSLFTVSLITKFIRLLVTAASNSKSWNFYQICSKFDKNFGKFLAYKHICSQRFKNLRYKKNKKPYYIKNLTLNDYLLFSKYWGKRKIVKHLRYRGKKWAKFRKSFRSAFSSFIRKYIRKTVVKKIKKKWKKMSVKKKHWANGWNKWRGYRRNSSKYRVKIKPTPKSKLKQQNYSNYLKKNVWN